MKKCKSCGALQKDERTTCIDCGEMLGKSLTDRELESAEEMFHNQLEDMTEDTDELRVTKFDLVLIILHILLTIAITVLTFINPTGDEDVGITLIGVLIWNIICLVKLAFPETVLKLHTLSLKFRYSKGRKIVSIIFLLLDAVILYELIT